jgi:hypothetical protein
MNIENIPILVAFLRLSTGNLPVAIEIKMMLSIPRQFLERSMLIGDPSIRI